VLISLAMAMIAVLGIRRLLAAPAR
jgi:hypothetical protein